MRGEFDHYRNIVDRDPVQYRHELFEYLNDIGFDNKLKEAYIGFFDASDKPEESYKPHCADLSLMERK